MEFFLNILVLWLKCVKIHVIVTHDMTSVTNKWMSVQLNVKTNCWNNLKIMEKMSVLSTKHIWLRDVLSRLYILMEVYIMLADEKIL